MCIFICSVLFFNILVPCYVCMVSIYHSIFKKKDRQRPMKMNKSLNTITILFLNLLVFIFIIVYIIHQLDYQTKVCIKPNP